MTTGLEIYTETELENALWFYRLEPKNQQAVRLADLIEFELLDRQLSLGRPSAT